MTLGTYEPPNLTISQPRPRSISLNPARSSQNISRTLVLTTHDDQPFT